MATLIIHVCDQHAAAGEEVEAQGWSFSITPPGERTKSFDVDLCEQCAKGLVDLVAHFDDIARRSAGPSAKARPAATGRAGVTLDDPGAVACPECGQISANRASLGGHARRVHNTTLTELLGEEEKFQCLTCPAPHPKFGSGTGFSAHRRNVHNIPAGTPLAEGEDLKKAPGRKASKRSTSKKKSTSKDDADTLL